MPRIDRIRIHNFRGASTPLDIEFAKNKRMIVIFGENGTGKTTIVDALDAVANCSGGSLTTKSSTNLRAHMPTAGKKSADMVVEITAGNLTWRASLNRNELVTTPMPRPKILVLRRTNLQRFIDSQPAERYKELRHLIAVEQVERSEEALKRASDDVKQQFDEAVWVRSNSEEQLENLWRDQGCPDSDWATWAKTEASKDSSGLMQQARTLRATREAIVSALRSRNELALANAALADHQRRLDHIQAEVAQEPGMDGDGALQLVEILASVKQYLSSGQHADVCPVCEQKTDIVGLRSTLDLKLDEFKRYQSLSSRRQEALDRLRATQSAASTKRNDLVTEAVRLVAIANGEPIGFAPLALDISGFTLIRNGSEDTEQALAQSVALIDVCEPVADALLAEEEAVTRAAGRVNLIQDLYSRAEASKVSTLELEQLLKRLHAALDLVRNTRIEFTQGILNEVADECNRLYCSIHPNEGMAVSKVELDRQRRASLNQTVNFEGHLDVPPQAFLSEAHLDTLGFCFWFAFAKRENRNGDTVVVFDDVFSSVDAPHMSRIADLVVDECEHFAQMIVTTHQRRWRDIYKYSQGPGNQVDLIELQRWSLSKGISSHKTPLAVSELAAAVSAVPFDRLTVASRAGILLEATLVRLARLYGCSVRMKPENDHTLGELLDGTASLFKRLELRTPTIGDGGQTLDPASYESSRPGEIHAALKASLPIRNQVGAHFNLHGMDISDTEVVEFGGNTVRLLDMLTCEICGQMPSKSTGSYFKCSCQDGVALQMHPVQLI
jgi:wobble nucleotide-excising tRNase